MCHAYICVTCTYVSTRTYASRVTRARSSPWQGMPRLEYRSIEFHEEWIEEPDDGYFQEVSPPTLHPLPLRIPLRSIAATIRPKAIPEGDAAPVPHVGVGGCRARSACWCRRMPRPFRMLARPCRMGRFGWPCCAWQAMVVNHPSADVDFTRIVEYKHVPNQPSAVKEGKIKGTLIAKEISSAVGDPYYPVPNPENRALYERYRELAEAEQGVCFVGRLASYKYFNMDQVHIHMHMQMDMHMHMHMHMHMRMPCACTCTATTSTWIRLNEGRTRGGVGLPRAPFSPLPDILTHLLTIWPPTPFTAHAPLNPLNPGAVVRSGNSECP